MRYRKKMTGTPWLGLVFLAAAVCCTGCGRSEDQLRKDYKERSGYTEEETAYSPDISGQDGTEDITDTEQMPDALKELYGFRNLEDHKLYWNQTVMQKDSHFNEDVTYSELDSAQYFALDKFVMNNWNQNAQTPYDSWLMEHGWGNVIPQVRCRLFVADSLRGDRLLVLVDTPRVLAGSVTDSIQEGIADMAPVRIEEYPLIVLIMVSDGTPYYTSVFVNKERGKGWTALDWVNAVTEEDR